MPQLPGGQPRPKIAIIESVHREGVYQTIWYCKLLFLIAGARLGMLLVGFGFQRFVMLNEGLIVIETSMTNASTPTSSISLRSASSSSPLPTPIPIRDLEYGDSDVFKSPNKLFPEDFQLPPLVPTPARASADVRTPPPVIDSFSVSAKERFVRFIGTMAFLTAMSPTFASNEALPRPPQCMVQPANVGAQLGAPTSASDMGWAGVLKKLYNNKNKSGNRSPRKRSSAGGGSSSKRRSRKDNYEDEDDDDDVKGKDRKSVGKKKKPSETGKGGKGKDKGTTQSAAGQGGSKERFSKTNQRGSDAGAKPPLGLYRGFIGRVPKLSHAEHISAWLGTETSDDDDDREDHLGSSCSSAAADDYEFTSAELISLLAQTNFRITFATSPQMDEIVSDLGQGKDLIPWYPVVGQARASSSDLSEPTPTTPKSVHRGQGGGQNPETPRFASSESARVPGITSTVQSIRVTQSTAKRRSDVVPGLSGREKRRVSHRVHLNG